MSAKAKTGGGGKKKDRNRVWCAAYRARAQREINKVKRIARHLRRQPEDRGAIGHLGRLAAYCKLARVTIPEPAASPADLRRTTMTRIKAKRPARAARIAARLAEKEAEA